MDSLSRMTRQAEILAEKLDRIAKSDQAWYFMFGQCNDLDKLKKELGISVKKKERSGCLTPEREYCDCPVCGPNF